MSGPSSYIPTTTAAVTREADVMSMEGTDFSEWFSDTKGTFFVEFYAPPIKSSGTQVIAGFHGGISTERWVVQCVATGDIQARHIEKSSGTFDAVITLVSGYTPGQMYRVAMAIDGSTLTSVIDGGAVGSKAINANAVLTTKVIGARDNGLDGVVSLDIVRTKYYPQRLTNTQLIALTRS